MNKVISTIVTLAIVVVFTVSAKAQINDGGYVITVKEVVEVTALGSNAGYTSELTALVTHPDGTSEDVFCFNSKATGSVVNLGELDAGTIIEFKLDVNEGCKKVRNTKVKFRDWKKKNHRKWQSWNSRKRRNFRKNFLRRKTTVCTEHSYYSDSSMNPDGFDHVEFNGSTFGFEDMYGGGDKDFNDCMFAISGQVVVISTQELEEVADELVEDSDEIDVVKLNHKDSDAISVPTVFATDNNDGNGLYYVGDDNNPDAVVVVDTEGNMVNEFYGADYGIVFDNFKDIQFGKHDGNLYVVMDDEWQLIVIQPDGTFVGKFRNKSGSVGSVVGMDLNETHMYFAKYNEATGTSYIDKYIVERYYKSTINLGNIKITDIAVANDGICYSTAGSVTKIDFEGNELWSISTGAQYLATNDDSLFISHDGMINVVDLEFGEEEFVVETPQTIADLEVTTPNQIHVLDTTGTSDGSGTFMHNYSF